MNNAISTVLRLSHQTQTQCISRSCTQVLRTLLGQSQPYAIRNPLHRSISSFRHREPRLYESTPLSAKWHVSRFATTSPDSFQTTFRRQKLRAHDPGNQEQGLSFQKGDLTSLELRDVFRTHLPPLTFSNRLLRVLHGRRVDGTLDLDPPPDMQAVLSRYPQATSEALKWLRENYPVDEDAAILARIEREESTQEQESPAELIQRGEDLGLYGPQSGNFRAKLSEKEDDVFGQSELDRIRERNIKVAEQEEEELQAQIDRIQGEVKEAQTRALALAPEQGIEVAQELRPPNELEKWVLKAKNRSQSKFKLDSPEVVEPTLRARLLPSFVFVALVCAGCYFYALWWEAPRRSERMFPNVSLSFATIATIIAANVAIYVSWSLPPLWRVLNKYFIATPAYPRALSMLGNVFSHHTGRHLLYNMAGLLIFGLSLHEEVGRGVFVGLYLASGVVGSFASLTNFAVRGILTTSSLGASGSVWGIAAAYCWIHAYEKFSFVFIPEDWRDTVRFQGWQFLALMAVSQVVGFLSPLKNIDYMSHVAGIVVGMGAAEWWKQKQAREDPMGIQRQKRKPWKWYEALLGRQGSKE